MYHFQSDIRDWPEPVKLLPKGSLIKAIDRGDMLRDAKAVNPGVITMLRHHGGPQTIFGGSLADNMQTARDFLDTFIDGTFREEYAAHTDYIQDWNEYVASTDSEEETRDRILWVEAVSRVWYEEYRRQDDRLSHIDLALVSAPVGNDIPRQMAEIAIEYGAALSYHAYDLYFNKQRHDGSWRYHCGRWHFMEQQWGLKPDWLHGECGPYFGVHDGWRDSSVLDFDREAYVAAMRRWVRDIQQTPAYREGRHKGFALFTTGRVDDQWRYYWTERPEMDMLASMFAEEWKPGSEPPPPDPDPRSYNRTYHLGPQDWAPDEKEAVVQVAHKTRSTVGQSADDAFLNAPELKARNVVAWEVERITGIEDTEQAQAALEDFNETHYPPLANISYRWTRDLFVADRFDFPVGTKEERDSSEIPPGNWTVSTGFNQRYQIVEGGAFHRHTGWDLNNQSPYWDSDRNYPVRACANGRIIHMVLFPDSSSWGRVCIVEHELPDGRIVHTRYSHLREFSERFSEGTWIRRGDVLGIIGRTNVSNGAFHLHWDVGISGILKTEPGHWCFDDAVCVSEHYVNPGQFVEARH